jgi:hypothetical protein
MLGVIVETGSQEPVVDRVAPGSLKMTSQMRIYPMKMELDICDLIDIKFALKHDVADFRKASMPVSADHMQTVLDKIQRMIDADRESTEPLRIKLSA